MDFEGVNFSLD